MNFTEAVKLAQEGKYIRNTGWCSYQYIYIPKRWEKFNDVFIDEDGDEYVFYANEILNNNWIVCQEEPKTYSFQEALKALEKGKKISRPFELAPGRKRTLRKIVNDDGSFIMYEDDGKKVYQLYKLDQFSFYYTDIVATDWIIEE